MSEAPSIRKRLAPAILILLAAAHAVLTRLSWQGIPLQIDTGIWAYMGGRILDGAKLYGDLWDQKPPGIYYTFAAVEWLFGIGGDQGLFWLDAAISLLVLAVSYNVARRFSSATASAAAILILSILFCHRVLADWGDNCEKFVALLEMTALWLLISGLKSRQSAIRWICVGICCAAAVSYKQTGILLLVATTLVLSLDRLLRNDQNRIKHLALIWLGFFVVWIPILAAHAAAGTLFAFWHDVILYDLQRVSPLSEGGRIGSGEHWSQIWNNLRYGIILFVPAALALPWRSTRETPASTRFQNPAFRLIFLYWLLAILAFAVAPYGYGHYLLQAAPPGAVLAAIAFDRTQGAVSGSWKIAFSLSLIAGAAQLGDHFRFTFDENYTYRTAYEAQRIRVEDLVDIIKQRSERGQSVMIWPPDNAVSYYAGRRTPLECSNASVIWRRRLALLTPAMDEIIRRLELDPPEIVIDTTGIQFIPPGRTDPQPALMLETGLSLAEEPDENHPKTEGRILAPMKRWLREHYGGQERIGDLGTIYYRAKPWQDWREYLRPRPARNVSGFTSRKS